MLTLSCPFLPMKTTVKAPVHAFLLLPAPSDPCVERHLLFVSAQQPRSPLVIAPFSLTEWLLPHFIRFYGAASHNALPLWPQGRHMSKS